MYTNGVLSFGIYGKRGDGIVYVYSLEQMLERTVLFRRTLVLFDGFETAARHSVVFAFKMKTANL